MWDKCCAGCDGNNLLALGFVGPAVLVGYCCCHDRNGGTVLVGLWKCGVPIQEGPAMVFLVGVILICVTTRIEPELEAPA
jgi:hypothetical protein